MGTENGISEGRADYKVPGGKLIRVRVWHRNGIIEKVRFHGDFFIHPEEAIEELEEDLEGKRMNEAYAVIESFFSRVEYAGVGPDEFRRALSLAMKE